METNVNFLELAAYCKQETEKKCSESDNKWGYKILYAAIFDDNSIKVSCTPHILKDAKRCILVHRWQQLAVSFDYDTYLVQSINENGEVLEDSLDKDYSIHISPSSYNYVASISLTRNSHTIYGAKIWSNGENLLPQMLVYVWDLYKKNKEECKTLKESQLLGKLAKAEQRIQELNSTLADSSVIEQLLEAEVRQYRSLLDEIKKLLSNE